MKPKELKSPITFANRKPLLVDRVLYVPIFYDKHETFEETPFFDRDFPIQVEYCSGNGDWVIEKAKSEPQKNWIAVEKRFDRVRKIWSKMKNHAISNLLIVCGEAFPFTKYYLKPDSIEQIFINFPDPWPKIKHAKHRLFNPLFLDEVGRVLKNTMAITVVTDDSAYIQLIIAQFLAHPSFKPTFPPPFFIKDIPHYGTSWFEKLWREKGREIHYTTYQRSS